MYDQDIVVIGGGVGGYASAIHAAQLRARVTLVEKDKVGGACLNRGCIPTKTLVRSVELLQKVRQAAGTGIETDGIRADFGKLMAHKNAVVDRLVAGVEQLLKGGRINVIRGPGRILSPHEVQVNDRTISTGKIIIATGSEPATLPVPGVDLPGVLNTDGILELKSLPGSLVIIGGGYIGIEFAGIFSALGTKVTVIEALPRCLPTVEEEACNLLLQTLRRQGVEVKTNAPVSAIRGEGEALRVVFKSESGEGSATGQVVLAAVGRRPCTAGLGLEALGIEMNKRGIAANEHLETNVPGIYAAGDVLGRSMLAGVAFHEAEVAAKNAVGQVQCATDYRVVPTCVFTNPEIASVGITEKEAKERALDYRVSKFPFGACGAALAMDEAQGTAKMICDAGTGAVLGMHIIGTHASDLIGEVALAMKLGATAKDIAETIHVHPGLGEVVREAAMGQLGGAIHFRRVSRI